MPNTQHAYMACLYIYMGHMKSLASTMKQRALYTHLPYNTEIHAAAKLQI